MVVPNNQGFPTKNDHFGVFWWYHHFRKPPYMKSNSPRSFRGTPGHPNTFSVDTRLSIPGIEIFSLQKFPIPKFKGDSRDPQ